MQTKLPKPFLANNDEDFANFTGAEALNRGDKSMMEASLASGEIRNDLREALEKALGQ